MDNDFYTDKTQEQKTEENPGGNEAKMPGDEQEPLLKTVMEANPKTVTYAMISLLSGIISILCCCTGFGSLIFGGLAIAFFFISKKNLGYVDFRTILGLIFGIIGIAFAGVLVYEVLTMDTDVFLQEMADYLQSAEGGVEV